MNLKSSDDIVRGTRSDSEEAVQETVRVEGHQSKDPSHHGDGGDTDVPFDKGWAWMICLSCFMIFYVYAGYDQVVSVLLVDILRDLDTTVSIMSVMFSVSTCFYCLSTQLTNNFLLNHVSNRCLQTVAAVVNVLATLMFVIHPNSTLFLVAAFIKAAAKGTSLISTLTMVGHYFKRRRALAVALGLMGGSVSSISVPPLTRYLRDKYGLRGCFLLVAGLEMHAVMATMILRPINSYGKRKLHVSKNSNGAVNEGENSLLLSPQTVQKDISSGRITAAETVESRTLDVITSAEDVQLGESRNFHVLKKKGHKADGSTCANVSRGEVAASGLRTIALGTANKNAADLFDRCYYKKIPVSVHNSVSRRSGVVDSGSLLSNGSDGQKDQDKDISGENACCLDNRTPVNLSFEAQLLNGGSLVTISDRDEYNERDQQMAIDLQITDTHINKKLTLDIPNLNRKGTDIHKENISPLTLDMQSNDTNPVDIGAHVISRSGIQTPVIQTPDTQSLNISPDMQTHVIQTNDTKSLDTHTPDQDETKIIVIGKNRRDLSLTRSFPSRWHSASSSIIGSDLAIQAIAEENIPTANQSPKERKSGKIWKMISWVKVIINFSLLKNAMCVMTICIYCLVNGGILNMIYLPAYARHVGIASEDAAILMTVLGACDMAARILSGFFVDLKIVKVHVIMGVAIFCSGVVSQCLGMFLTFELLMSYVVIQGLIGSVGASLDMVLIVETLGIDYLSKVLPMCSLFLNVSIATQQLIVGALIEYTKNYVVAFQYVGCMYLLASILLLGLPVARKLQQEREKKH